MNTKVKMFNLIFIFPACCMFILTYFLDTCLAISEQQIKLESAIREIESGNKNHGLQELEYMCNKLFMTDACDYLNKQLKEEIIYYTLDAGYKFYDAKEYKKAFAIFDNHCKTGSSGACFMVGLCYELGNGVKQNFQKAIEVFSLPTLKDNDSAKLQMAFTYEYGLGSRYAIFHDASDIYRKLIHSPKENISKEAQKGLERLKIYSFLENAFGSLSRYNRDLISYDQLEKQLFDLNMTAIPSDIRESFLGWRLPFLKLAKFRSDNSLSSTLLGIGKSAVKGFLLDFSFITDAWDKYDGGKEMDKVALEQKHYWQLFINALEKNEVSVKFFNSLQ